MARAKVKQREGEDFSDATLERVISALNRESPITKKSACEMLNITYNTKRLNTIIENYQDRKEYAKKRRKLMRTKAIENSEKVEIIADYLAGISLQEISDSTFRSIPVVKRVLKQFNVPLRDASNSYSNPAYVEESRDNYTKGDLVFAARYGVPAYIEALVEETEEYNIYKIYLLGDYERYAHQASYDLADLTKIQKMGVKINTLPGEEVKRLLYESWLKSKKLDTKGK